MSAKIAGLILAPLVIGATIIYGSTHKDMTSSFLGSTEGIFKIIRENALVYAGILDDAKQSELVYIRGFARSLLDILYVNPDDVPPEDKIKMLELTFNKDGNSPLEDIIAALGPIAKGVLAAGNPGPNNEPLVLQILGGKPPDGYLSVEIKQMGGDGEQKNRRSSLDTPIGLTESDMSTIRSNNLTDNTIVDKNIQNDAENTLNQDKVEPTKNNALMLYVHPDIKQRERLSEYFQAAYFDEIQQVAELAQLKKERPTFEKINDYNPLNIFNNDPTRVVSPLSNQIGGAPRDDITLAMHVIKPYIPLYVIKLSRIALYQYLAIYKPCGPFSWRWLFLDLAITLMLHAFLVILGLMPFDLETVLTDASFGMIVITCLTIIMNVVQPDDIDEASVANRIDDIVAHISPYVLLVPIPVYSK